MIMTVKGAIQPDDLGIVAMHEHVVTAFWGWENDPSLVFNRPEAFDGILARLKEFKRAGGQTLVDCGGILMGRDAEMLMNLSSASGVQIVASTGFSREGTVPGHFLPSQLERPAKGRRQTSAQKLAASADYLADMFYDELEKGMAGPGMIRTGIKAGIVRATSSWNKIAPVEEVSLRAAAVAAKRAGVTLTITDAVNQARRQLEMAMAEGLEPDRIIIGHCDDGRAIDLERDKEIASTGAYVSYDHIGWEAASIPHAIPDEQRVELVKAMVAAGFSDRIVLSCDAIGYAIGMPQPKHSFAHLLKSFVPRLKKAGVTQKTIDTILIENPKRILTCK